MRTVERELLTIRDLTTILGLSDRSIRRLIAEGRIPVLTFGRTVRIHRQDVDRLLEQRTRRGSRAA